MLAYIDKSQKLHKKSLFISILCSRARSPQPYLFHRIECRSVTTRLRNPSIQTLQNVHWLIILNPLIDWCWGKWSFVLPGRSENRLQTSGLRISSDETSGEELTRFLERAKDVTTCDNLVSIETKTVIIYFRALNFWDSSYHAPLTRESKLQQWNHRGAHLLVL